MKRPVYLALRFGATIGPWLRRRCTPAGRLTVVVVLAGAVVGIDTSISVVYQLFSFAAALLLVAMLGALRRPPHFEVRRHLPRHATAGTPMRYRLEVCNQGAHATRGLRLLEEVVDSGSGRGSGPTFESFARQRLRAAVKSWRASQNPASSVRIPECDLPPLAAGERARVTLEFTPPRRGAIEFSSTAVLRADPLGLFRALRRSGAPGSLLVLPKRFAVPRLELPGVRVHQPGGVALSSSVGDSEEFFGLRDYRPGDPLQRMHWKSFARTGKPVVKEFHDEFFERHALVLDTYADPSALDDGVSLAASFASTIDTHESLLDLLFVGTEAYCYTAGRGLLQVDSLLEVLAHVQPNRTGSFTMLREVILERAGRLSGCILILLDWDEPRRALLDELRAGGLAIFVYLITADAQTYRTPPPGVHVLRAGHVPSDLSA